MFRVDREGPSWHSHPWGVWRDGEPCETSLTNGYVLPYLLWEVTRLLLDGVTTQIPIHAACVARDRRAVVLAGGTTAARAPSRRGSRRGDGASSPTRLRSSTCTKTSRLSSRSGAPSVSVWVARLDRPITSAGDDPEALVPASQLGA